MANLTKKQKSLAEKLGDNQKLYAVDDAIKLLKDLKSAKFDESLEVSLNLGVDPRHADQMVRGMVTLPSGTGKDIKVAVIATPDMMGIVGRLGKVLGPKGLMPNPKLGTVTPNVAEAVKAAKGGQIEFRVEKAGIIHGGIGKLSFSDDALRANFDAFVDAIVKAKPAGAKGKYLRKVGLSSSMGPGLKIDVAQVQGG